MVLWPFADRLEAAIYWCSAVVLTFCLKSLEKCFEEVYIVLSSRHLSHETILKLTASLLAKSELFFWKIFTASVWHLPTCFLPYIPNTLQIMIIYFYFITCARFSIFSRYIFKHSKTYKKYVIKHMQCIIKLLFSQWRWLINYQELRHFKQKRISLGKKLFWEIVQMQSVQKLVQKSLFLQRYFFNQISHLTKQ